MADVKPIRSEADYEAALAEIENLWGAKSGTPKGDRLDVLATLIDAWETVQYPFASPDPIEAIKFRMEQMQLSKSDLGDILGYTSRVSEILNRKRKLTLEMVRNLHKKLNIPLESLVRSY